MQILHEPFSLTSQINKVEHIIFDTMILHITIAETRLKLKSSSLHLGYVMSALGG